MKEWTGRTEVCGKPHEPQGESVDGGLCGPLIRRPPSFPQSFENEVLNIVGEAGGSQLALVPSIVLGHHDEGHPEVFKDSWGIYVGLPDVLEDAAISDELVGKIRGIQSGSTETTEGCGGIKLGLEDVGV